MSVLRFNSVHTTLAVALDADDTTISLEAALQEGGTNVPTLSGGDVILLGIEDEIVALTAYTAGATTGTITRGHGDTLPAAHDAGVTVGNVITKGDVFHDNNTGDLYQLATDSGTQSLASSTVASTLTDAVLENEDTPADFASFNTATDEVEMLESGWFNVIGDVSASGTTVTGNFQAFIFIDEAGGGDELFGPWQPFISDDVRSKFEGVRYLEAGWTLQLKARQVTGESVDVYNALIELRRISG